MSWRQVNGTSLRSVILCAAILCAWNFLNVPSAFAHAVLVQSTPRAHEFVKGPTVAIELRYNSRVDAARSTLLLLGPSGKTHTLVAVQSSPGSITAKAAQLAGGTYVLRWQALSTDGHVTRGELQFQVK